MSRTFLITGATGFVGKQVLKAISEHGFYSRVIVRKGKSDLVAARYKTERIIETEDLFNESEHWWQKACEGIDTIIHVAWYAEPGKYLQSPLNLQCLAGSLNMISAAAKAGVHKIVGVGTCFEYDLTHEKLSIETPLKPGTAYASCKAALFNSLDGLSGALNIKYNWCRLFYLHGEDEDERRLVSYIHSKLAKGEPAELTSGTQVRDFLDVSDAGRMIAQVSIQTDYSGPVNICSGIPVTIKQLAEKIADTYGRRDLLKFGARPDNLVDPAFVLGIKNLDM